MGGADTDLNSGDVGAASSSGSAASASILAFMAASFSAFAFAAGAGPRAGPPSLLVAKSMVQWLPMVPVASPSEGSGARHVRLRRRAATEDTADAAYGGVRVTGSCSCTQCTAAAARLPLLHELELQLFMLLL